MAAPPPRFFVAATAATGVAPGDTIALPREAAHHARTVLRLRPGEPIVIHDGAGMAYACALASVGPQAVEAGECDRCGAEPRLTQTCGPSAYPCLGRECALAAGEDAWCEGHAAEARAALGWLAALDADADDVARLWWLTTGEVRLNRDLVGRLVRVALPPG